MERMALLKLWMIYCGTFATVIPQNIHGEEQFASCPNDRFKCKHSGKCIVMTWRCDFDPDCGNGDDSDEENCESCFDGQFRCIHSGRCISSSSRCDNIYDCRSDDKSDEENCPKCPGRFECKQSGVCISSTWRCDKQADCPDGDLSDEENCDSTSAMDESTLSAGLQETSSLSGVITESTTVLPTSLKPVVVPCGGHFTEESATLKFPAKIYNQFCDFLITVSTGRTITIILSKQIGLKEFGYTLKVYDGTNNTGNLLGIIQFLRENWNRTSNGNHMYITYVRSGPGTKDISASYFSNFTECEKGTYGIGCSKSCINCIDETCDKLNGTCTTTGICKAGYMGPKCDQECEKGTYGLGCNKSCINCIDEICDKLNGTCTTAGVCKPGYMSPKCDQGCTIGTYGLNCTEHCSNCDSENCHPVDGICQRGCKPGWKDSMCKTVCTNGTFGMNCREHCSNCESENCDPVHGICKDGCKPGWKDLMCKTACKRGTYGLECNKSCINCIDETCDKLYGTCTTPGVCKPGYMGPKCDQGINQCLNKTLNTCPHNCEISEFGSLECRCWDGYIGDDGRNCRIDFVNIGKHINAIVMTVNVLGPYTWNDSLNNNESTYYKQVESTFSRTVHDILKHHSGYRETKVIGFRSESIVVDFAIIITKWSNVNDFNQTIQQYVTSQSFGNMTVMKESLIVRSDLGYIYDIAIKPQYMAYENMTSNIICEASAISLPGRIKFEWKINNSTIRPTLTSRITLLYQRITNTKYSSTLRIRNITTDDAGTLECTAVLGNESKLSQSSKITVYSLQISTDTSSVENGCNAIVKCSVCPHNEEVMRSLMMCRNGEIISELIYLNTTVEMNLKSLTQHTEVGCKWKEQNICTKSVNIDVFNPEFKPCSKQHLDKITWNETYPGITNYVPCPADFIGLASRYCEFGRNFTGEWKEPDLFSCTRKTFASIADRLTRIKDGFAVHEINTVLSEFTNVTKSVLHGNDTVSADIKSGVDILTTASIILSSRDENVTEKEREDYFTATNSILDGDKEEVWKGLNEKTGENQAAKIMNLVSNISDLVLKTLSKNTSVNIVLNNMVTQIKRAPIEQITFPDKNTMNTTTDFSGRVILNKNTILNSFNVKENETLDYTATYYRTISDLLQTNKSISMQVGSNVIAFSITNKKVPGKLNPPIQLFFETVQTNFTNAKCSYWNFDWPVGGNWANDGCETVLINDTAVECRCDHLTNFAVLLSMKEMSNTDHGVLSTISMVGCIISILCLALTLILYFIEWKNLTSNKAVILVILCMCLIFAYITFLLGIERTENKDVCTAIAVLLHFLFLTVLFLMAAEGIIHAVLVIAVFPQRQSINKLLIPLAFGIPALIVTISGIVTRLNGYGTDKFCWLSQKSGLIYAFFVPCAVVVLLNFTITGLVLKKLFSVRATMSKKKKEKLIIGIRSVAILTPVFGLTWVFGLLSFQEHATGFSYLFVIFNSFQGVAIFLLHGVLNKLARKSVAKRVSRFRKQEDYFTTKSSESANARTTNISKKFKFKTETTNYSSVEKSSVVMNPTYDTTCARTANINS